MGNTNEPFAAGKPPETTESHPVFLSFGGSTVSDKNNSAAGGSSTSKNSGLRHVPVEMQDAILELLETCKE